MPTFPHRPFVVIAAAVAALQTGPLAAACLTDAEADALAAAYDAKRPAANPDGLSAADGACSRAKFMQRLQTKLGAPVGYKAGLTNPAVQKRFNATEPVWGALYPGMLLPAGAVVPANFGARPLYEADLLVRVADAGINQAKTPLDVLRAIDQVIPFIELPDLVVEAPPKLNGAAIGAINVGARLGVTGTPIALPATRAERYQWSDALRDMTVILKADGAEVDRGKGSDVLEHPLNAVVWLVQDLQRQNIALKPGDVVSLGSFSRLLPTKPGAAIEVEYWGLPGTPRVAMRFAP